MRFLLPGTVAAALVMLLPAAPAAALRTPAGGVPSIRQGVAVAPPFAQRLGRGRGTFRPRAGRPRTQPGFRPRRSVRSPSFRRAGRNILRFLGIAYLLNLLFGWGSGGSPLGLLVILGLITLLVVRHRRRAAMYGPRY